MSINIKAGIRRGPMVPKAEGEEEIPVHWHEEQENSTERGRCDAAFCCSCRNAATSAQSDICPTRSLLHIAKFLGTLIITSWLNTFQQANYSVWTSEWTLSSVWKKSQLWWQIKLFSFYFVTFITLYKQPGKYRGRGWRGGGAKCAMRDVKGGPVFAQACLWSDGARANWSIVHVEEELELKYHSHLISIDLIPIPASLSTLSIFGSIHPLEVFRVRWTEHISCWCKNTGN